MSAFSCHDESNAVVFKGTGLNITQHPIRSSPEQMWIFWDHEPPYKVNEKINLTLFNGIFDLAAAYSQDSHIPIKGLSI